MAANNCTNLKHLVAACKRCGICLRCPQDECLEDHTASNGVNARQLKKQRAVARKAENEQETERDTRETVKAIRTMNEEEMAKDQDERINGFVAEQHLDESNPFRQVLERLKASDKLATRLAERVSGFSAEQLSADRAADDCARFLEVCTKVIADRITVSADASGVALDLLEKRLLGKTKLVGSDTIERNADAFMRSSLPIRTREVFALLSPIPPKELRRILEAAKHRALASPQFMSNATPRFYSRKRRDEPGDFNEVDEAEDVGSETNSNDRELVEMSVEQQLNLKVAWASSRVRRMRGAADMQAIELGKPLAPTFSKSRVAVESVRETVCFLQECSLGWKGGATRHVSVMSGCRLTDVPFLNMALGQNEAWDKYNDLAHKSNGVVNGFSAVGKPTFVALYQGLAKVIESNHSLSYYFTDGIQAMGRLKAILERLKELWNLHRKTDAPASVVAEFTELGMDFENFERLLEEAEDHLKYELRVHVSTENAKCDGDILHCGCFAVGDHCDTPKHSLKCSACANYVLLPHAFRKLMNAVKNTLARMHGDEHDLIKKQDGPYHEIKSMGRSITSCQTALGYFQRHVIRAVWQSARIGEVVKDLKPGVVLVVLDHKQKIQPIDFKESAADYYGKKGMSLLGFYLRWRAVDGGPIESYFVDVISMNSKQNGKQVQAILQVFLPKMKEIIPAVTEVILLSDNGPAFSGKENIAFIQRQNSRAWNAQLRIVRWMFFESQCGKTALDTHFAFIGIYLRQFARKERAVKVHKDIYDALIDGGGIKNTMTILLSSSGDEGKDDEEVNDETTKGSSIKDIRKVHDICFSEDYVETYRFSKVSLGKAKYTRADLLREDSDRRSQASIISSFANPFVPGAITSAPQLPGARGEPSSVVSGVVSRHRQTILEEIVSAVTAPRPPPSDLLTTAGSRIGLTAFIAIGDESSNSIPKGTDEETVQLNHSWALAEMRKTPSFPSFLVPELKKMYDDGDISKNKLSASMAVDRLLELDVVRSNWDYRNACTEANVKKHFGTWTKEKKQQIASNAARQMHASSTTTTTPTTAATTTTPVTAATTTTPVTAATTTTITAATTITEATTMATATTAMTTTFESTVVVDLLSTEEDKEDLSATLFDEGLQVMIDEDDI